MKAKIIFFVLMMCIISHFSFSQYYGNLVEINRITGQHYHFGPSIPDAILKPAGIRAFNKNNGIYIFPTSSPNKKLFSINTANDSVLHYPLFNQIYVVELDYSNSLNKLFGLYRDTQNQLLYFVSIDLITGNYSYIGNPFTSYGTYAGMSSFNDNNNIYFDILPTNQGGKMTICSIDATTGNIISNPLLNFAVGEQIFCIAFDNSTNTLYSIMLTSSGINYLISIDPNTGICTKIGSGTTYHYGGGSAAIDEINHQFLLLNDSSKISIINAFDLTTGNLLYHKIVPLTCNGINDNFVDIKYDNSKNKLFALHWDECYTATSIIATAASPVCNDRCTGSATVTVTNGSPPYSYSWSTVPSQTTQTATNLCKGAYSVTVTDNNGNMSVANVTITNYPQPVPVISADTTNTILQCNPAFVSYQWIINGAPISGATNQNYTPTQNGSYTVHVTDSNGCEATAVKFDVSWVGLEELNCPIEAVLYQNEPNPFDGSTVIRYFIPEVSKGTAYIAFYDMYGKELKKIEITTKGFGKIDANTDNLASGIYTYSIIVNDVVIDSKKMMRN